MRLLWSVVKDRTRIVPWPGALGYLAFISAPFLTPTAHVPSYPHIWSLPLRPGQFPVLCPQTVLWN